jgi:methylated-DNA-[protein]-cysteine S-methyltransferase
MSQWRYDLFQTPVGWIGLLASDRGLRKLSLKPTPQEAMEELGPEVEGAAHIPSSTVQIQQCLEKFMDGDARALDEIDLDLTGAPSFFAAAWIACRSIPPGETRSYAWLAAEAGSPRAVRAAGQAMARNPLVLVIPCHRVIATNGELRGYGAGGLGVKARLLELEKAALAERV